MEEPHDNISSQRKGHNRRRKLGPIWRAAIEMAFIIFLFYSNLLMGEFERSNSVHGKNFGLAVEDIFTAENFVIACISAAIGHWVFTFFRNKL